MNPPKISVIIPVCNGERFLREAVNSIFQQDFFPFEIIVVDDGSTDGTAELSKSFGANVRYVFQENRGPASARNKGLSTANGEFIAFLDSDDLWPSDKLSKQSACLCEQPELDVTIGYTKCFDSEVTASDKATGAQDLILSVQLGSALFRKSAFEKVGLFDEELRYSEDQDWFLRAREQRIRITALEDITLYHRRHKHSMTGNPDLRGYQLTGVLKKSLDRRRQQNDGKASSLPTLADYIQKQ